MVVIIQMAADTGIRNAVVVSVVTLVTICDARMCPCQRPVIAMNRESSRFPAWVCGVAGSAGIRNTDGDMIWIG